MNCLSSSASHPNSTGDQGLKPQMRGSRLRDQRSLPRMRMRNIKLFSLPFFLTILNVNCEKDMLKGNIGGGDEKIEGCFNVFNAEAEIPFARQDLSNLKCQFSCGEKGYSLSATGGQEPSCFCGNDYPSIYHRLEPNACDRPCNHDRLTCFAFTCCGSYDGGFFTVSFSGKVNIIKRILQQLAHDYRYNNPSFRSKTERSFPTVTVLQTTNQNKCLGIVSGCPEGWQMFGDLCYKLHWAEPRTALEAEEVCQGEGALLAKPDNQMENNFLSKLYGGCQGWIGSPTSNHLILRDSADSQAGVAKSERRVLMSMTPTKEHWTMVNDSISRQPIGDAYCYEIRKDGLWYRINCYIKSNRLLLCEKAAIDTTGPECTCLEGWVANGCTCYLREIRLASSWLDNHRYCQEAHQASLVHIRSGEENAFIQELIGQYLIFGHHVSTHIGLNNLMNHAKESWTYYENWDSSQQGHEEDGFREDYLSLPEGLRKLGINLKILTGWKSKTSKNHKARRSCARVTEDGKWRRASCNAEKAPCFVCKKAKGAPYPALRPEREEWDLDIQLPRDGEIRECDDCFRMYIKHATTQQYLCVDAMNHLYIFGWLDPSWCTFTLIIEPFNGGMVFRTPHGGVIKHAGEWGLKCEAWEASTDHYGKKISMFEDPDVLTLKSLTPLRNLVYQYLRLAIVVRSRDLSLPGFKKCSVLVHDISPRTESFECHHIGQSPAPNPFDPVELEQEALMFFAESRHITPRIPLRNTRMRCINNNPLTTVNCVMSYGEGLIVLKWFRARFGYTLTDSPTIRDRARFGQRGRFRFSPSNLFSGNRNILNAGIRPGNRSITNSSTSGITKNKDAENFNDLVGTVETSQTGGRGGRGRNNQDVILGARELIDFQNTFTTAFNNFYEVTKVRVYIETFTRQLGVQAIPFSHNTLQFAWSAEYIVYRWRAQLGARGTFQLLLFQDIIGDPTGYSLGDVSSATDLRFYIFGMTEIPFSVEMVLTEHEDTNKAWAGIRQPTTSQADYIRSGLYEFFPI